METLGSETNKVRTRHFLFQLNKSRQNKMFYLVLKASVIVTDTLVLLPLSNTFILVKLPYLEILILRYVLSPVYKYHTEVESLLVGNKQRRTRHFIFPFNKSWQNKMFYDVLKVSTIVTATLVLLIPSITFTLLLYLWAKPKSSL